MARNPNELRALTLLGQEIGRSIAPWPGKKNLRKTMARYPQVNHPMHSAENDSDSEFMDEIFRDLGCLTPDGFFIESQDEFMLKTWNPLCHHLCFIEVETTSRMTEYKLYRYAHAWDDFGDSQAWEFHVIIWDWYDQWRELDLERLYRRSTRRSEPERNPNDLISLARYHGDHALEKKIKERIAGAKYRPIQPIASQTRRPEDQ